MTNNRKHSNTTVVCSAVMLMVLPFKSYSWVTTPLPWTVRYTTISSSPNQFKGLRRSRRITYRDSIWKRNILEDINVLERTTNMANFFNQTNDKVHDISIDDTVNNKEEHTMWLFSKPSPAIQPFSHTIIQSSTVSSKDATPDTNTSSLDSSRASLVEGRQSLLMVFALLAGTIAIISFAQTDVGSNLIPYLSPIDGMRGGGGGGGISTVLDTTRTILSDPKSALEAIVDRVHSMGPWGVVYFGLAYTICEILAVPAIPLTASAGYLFGPLEGTLVVLLSASVAAAISFAIGRTLLREYVEGILQEYPKFAKLDHAIGKEGFKLMLLLRLSPIFPFALSNYLYGASSIDFPAFFGGTLLGFAPGTLAYVYTGYIGKALTTDGVGDVYPWYVYLGGLTLCASLLKVLADTATRIVEEIESEDNEL